MKDNESYHEVTYYGKPQPRPAVILHLMGVTCAGKSTLIDELLRYQGVAAVQIGKELRKKYGEAYFKGSGAPAHTAAEAMEIYTERVSTAITNGARLIVVDGQPRDVGQAQMMLHAWPHQYVTFYTLHASHAVREARARAGREPGPNLELAIARLTNDYKDCYNVLMELLGVGVPVHVISTDVVHIPSEAREILETWVGDPIEYKH